MGSTRRLFTALITYSCLLAQVSTLAHRILVQHVTCAEHGEAIHVRSVFSDEAASPSSDSDRAARSRLERTVARVGDLAAVTADEHDHCSVAGSRALTPRDHRAEATGQDPGLDRLGPAPDLVTGSLVATYVIAPKTSPPRRA